MNIQPFNAAVLCLSAFCLANSGTALAKNQALSMTEKNIQECTNLLNKVAASDQKIYQEMQTRQGKAAQMSAAFSANNPMKSLESNTQAVSVKTAPVAAKELPVNTQVFGSDNPRAIDHLTGKNTTPFMSTPDVAPKASKPKANSSAKLQPRIQLFAPNEVDLNHLQGKSANIEQLKKSKKTVPEKTSKAVKSNTENTAAEKVTDAVVKQSI